MLFVAIRYLENKTPILALTITVDFVHVLFRYPTNDTLLNDFRILPADMFDNLQIFHCNLTSISKAPSLLTAKSVPRAALLQWTPT